MLHYTGYFCKLGVKDIIKFIHYEMAVLLLKNYIQIFFPIESKIK